MIGLPGSTPGVIQTILSASHGVSAAINLVNDGTATSAGVGGYAWVAPANATVAAYWQVKVDVTAGALTSGDSTGVWLDLSTNRGWTVTGSGSATLTFSFREKASTTVRKVQTGVTITV
jgi:hypothetical protein